MNQYRLHTDGKADLYIVTFIATYARSVAVPRDRTTSSRQGARPVSASIDACGERRTPVSTIGFRTRVYTRARGVLLVHDIDARVAAGDGAASRRGTKPRLILHCAIPKILDEAFAPLADLRLHVTTAPDADDRE